jgi:gamma-D-glutamyl-L-lysine dipeptidyl-peptidase
MPSYCHLSIVPVRKEPSHKSELVTQLLFGETVDVLEQKDNWCMIQGHYDGYTGWVNQLQLMETDDEEIQKLASIPLTLATDLVQIAVWNRTQMFPLVIGSRLPFYSGKSIAMGERKYQFEGNVVSLSGPRPEKLLEHAYMFINVPYLWGGRTPFGIDCSGFTQLTFKLCGIKIPRDAWQQSGEGETVNLLEESKPGDLAFFDNAEGKIVHTGIILPGNHIIHAHGQVRIDKLDHQGIYNDNQKKYTHNLRLLKRNFN